MSLKRIIVHWTAGTHTVNDLDKQHYHFIIGGDGEVVKGFYDVSANENTKDGHYAAHTLGCNTGSIGVSMAAMGGAVEKPFKPGKYPLLEEQWNAMIELVAQLAKEHQIPITRQTILSHAEVEPTLGIKQKGKWDVSVLPFNSEVSGAIEVGDLMRAAVKAKIEKMPKVPVTMEPKPLLGHRRVQTLLGSLTGSGGIVGLFTGWDWKALAVMGGFALIVLLIFVILYRHEIKAGCFTSAKK